MTEPCPERIAHQRWSAKTIYAIRSRSAEALLPRTISPGLPPTWASTNLRFHQPGLPPKRSRFPWTDGWALEEKFSPALKRKKYF